MSKIGRVLGGSALGCLSDGVRTIEVTTLFGVRPHLRNPRFIQEPYALNFDTVLVFRILCVLAVPKFGVPVLRELHKTFGFS
jgi:hypothetical protein